MTESVSRPVEYYLHVDGIQYGPYSLDELRGKTIRPGSYVWFTGVPDWIAVDSVDALTTAIRTGRGPNVHPPMGGMPATPTQHGYRLPPAGGPVGVSHGRGANPVLLLVAGLALIAATAGVMYGIQQRQQADLIQKVNAQEALIKAQTDKIKMYERAEAQRQAEAARKRRERRLQTLKVQYEEATTQLQLALEKLDDLKGFHLFRTDEEREADIRAQLDQVKSWEAAVANVRAELDRL